jgi:fimbrial isopeptide formation D2 family protein/LPXTG-motif cell wall-anchored protein
MKKLISLVLALCMMLMVGTVFAEDPAASSLTPATSTADTPGSAGTDRTAGTWRGLEDGWISITGLTKGDAVKFYQILAYDQDAYNYVADAESAAKGAGSWKAIAPFAEMTLDDFKYILTEGISAEIAGRLAGMVSGDGIPATADDNGFAAVRAPAAGLYIALITPADPEIIYNPVFVGADYYTNTSGAWKLTGDIAYDPAAMAKKEKITLEKDITDQTGETRFDRKIGDTVEFTINSKVPAFSGAYEDPEYILTDTMSDGLELQTIPTVTIAGLTGENALVESDYEISPSTITEGITSFTVTIKDSGLAKVAKTGLPQDIVVVYTAKITSIENYNVNEKDNTATVKFSNNPGDSDSYSLLEDRTRNYTFSLDANLLGHSGWENSELVKIGKDADGNEIYQETLSNGTLAGVLYGAEFGLYTDKECTSLYTNDLVNPAIDGKYTSDQMGKLHINGLDRGTYYLKELNAPDGYVKDQATYQIDIVPVYTDVDPTTYTKDGILVKVSGYQVLASYTVKVTNLTTNESVDSTFTIQNEGTYDVKATTISETDETTKLQNIRGVELPSTGGIGTTIFYILGGLLVVGAAVILVARRKAQD